jgi:hypothetical protein
MRRRKYLNLPCSNMCEQDQENDDTGVDALVENQATVQEDSIIDETLNLSTVRDCTRSKSKKYVSQNLSSPLIPMTSSLVHHAARKLNVGQAYHVQVSQLNFSAETRTNVQVPPARRIMPEGDGLAAASLNDSTVPTAGVELYTAAAVVIFCIEPTIFPSVDAVARRTGELRRGARASLRHSTCNSTKDNICVRQADQNRQLPDPKGVWCGYAIQVHVTTMAMSLPGDIIEDEWG